MILSGVCLPQALEGVFEQLTDHLFLEAVGMDLDRIEARLIEMAEHGQHHIRAHVGCPQTLLAVAHRGVDEADLARGARLRPCAFPCGRGVATGRACLRCNHFTLPCRSAGIRVLRHCPDVTVFAHDGIHFFLRSVSFRAGK